MPTRKSRPNILLITSDQQRGDCFGFEGRNVKTPHLDRMAGQGTRFSNCITPNVVCQPARASMLTGLLPLTHGVVDNGYDLSAGISDRGFAARLAGAGYKTGFLGKAHFSSYQTFEPTGTPECRFSQPNYGSGWFGPYMGFDHVELLIGGHYRVPPPEPPYGQHYERWYYGDGLGEEKNRLLHTHLPPDTGAPQTWNSALPPVWHNSTWVGDRTVEFLNRHNDQPFCLWVSFADPHPPFDCPEPWSRLHHPDEVDLPPQRALDLDRRPWWHGASLEKPSVMPPEIKEKWESYTLFAPESEAQLRHSIANYYGMTALVDHQVGRILSSLEELGIAGDTLVAYTSDHGDWLGDHGLMLKGPMIYEGLLRMGLILRGPGVPAGQVVEDPVSTLDLPATFLEYGGLGADSAMHGRDLGRLMNGGKETRDFALNEWNLKQSPFAPVALKLRTVRTRRHKLTLELDSGEGELYDLENDPDEMDNLFGDAGYTAVCKELKDMIRSRPRDEMDPVPSPTGWT